MGITISLRDALLGFRRTLRHLDGHDVLIENTRISSPNQTLSLPGEGMPLAGVPSEFGALHVALTVEMPPALTEVERAFVAAHFDYPASAASARPR